MKNIIAIDGPAASGKSTVARGVASALGFLFVSSGHFYRALAWGIEGAALTEESLQAWLEKHTLLLEESPQGLRLLLDGKDATPHLSEPEVAAKVSQLAAFPAVRDFVNARLRTLATTHDLVMEGRDIGSIVFPETPFKFYLDASPEERARRRAGEGTIDSIAERDRLDSSRATAPLSIPKDARVIDTTHLGIEQVIAAVLAHLGALKKISGTQ